MDAPTRNGIMCQSETLDQPLVDSWYMRRRVVLPLLKRGMCVIGQVVLSQ
jgi:hypothetical protein